MSDDEKSIVPGADELFEPETIARKKALMQLESLKGDTAEAKRMRKAFAMLNRMGEAEGVEATAETQMREMQYKSVLASEDAGVVKRERQAGKLFTALGRMAFLMLELSCRQGFNDVQVCAATGIPLENLAKWRIKYPKLEEVMNGWREEVMMLANRNVFTAVSEGDLELSKWLLERRQSEQYAKKSKVEIQGQIGHSHVHRPATPEELLDVRKKMGLEGPAPTAQIIDAEIIDG